MQIKELEKLLSEMSLEEKVSQMIQINGNMMKLSTLVTGPTESIDITDEMLSMVGTVLNVEGAEKMCEIQQKYTEAHPHHIPLLLMYDVINGMETIFPIPLAQGCTFSPDNVEKAASIAAKEAAASGLHVTFSPMLDLVRDARWGRVMESPGEDPWLNGEMGKAMVRGYQGNNALNQEGNISACVKHFAGYGLPDGGREYDNVEISERTFREDYLPAYKAAIDEGARMVMSSFNTYNRVPSTGNKWLMRKILREEMGFDGVVIADYGAVEELVAHGIAEDTREAAKLAIEAGVDIDMVSNCYSRHLVELVRSGDVEEKLVDEAVMRILKLKNDLGLFENPCKDASGQKEKELFACEEHRKVARKIAAESFVLLKNEQVLPLSKENDETVAFIGPYIDTNVLYGAWSFPTNKTNTVTIRQGADQKKDGILYAEGAYILDSGKYAKQDMTKEPLLVYTQEDLDTRIQEAVEIAKKADKVVLCLGEHRTYSGEDSSRTSISLPENQMQLLRAIHQVNENIATLVFTGRPLAIGEVIELSKAVMITWMPGTEGGNAVADVLFADAVPQGKLTMSMPRCVGQAPIYYNRFTTGRPNPAGTSNFVNSCYMDESIKPLYPFGYGLSYTTFAYSEVSLSQSEMAKEDVLIAKATVTNTGSLTGCETVQLYLRDVKGSVVRPVKMLRGFEKVTLNPGESKEVIFKITEDMLKFYNINMEYISEPGEFHVFIGTNSDTENMASFRLIP